MNDAITPHRMAEILQMENIQAESHLFDRLRYLDRITKLSYAEIGFISKTVQQYLLHEHRTDQDTGKPMVFTKWLRTACPWSYAQAFAAMRDVTELADIPAEQLAEIPQANFGILKQLSTAVRAQPDVIQAAKAMPSEAFTEKIKRDFPGQKIEFNRTMRFRPQESAVTVINEALAKAMERGAANRNEALEWCMVTALEQFRYEEEIEAMEATGDENPKDQVPQDGESGLQV